MTHTNAIEQARIHSSLAETFCIVDDEFGKRWAAVGGYVLDYSTFCTMMLWSLGGAVVYIRILAARTGLIDELKEMNSHDTRLLEINEFQLIKRINYKVGKIMRNYSKDEVVELFEGMLATN